LSGDDYQELFGGGRPVERPSFAARVGRAEPAAAPPVGTPTEEAGSGAYKAFGFVPTSVGECCDVQRWLDGTPIAEGIEFQYRFLIQVGYVGEEQIKLFLPDCIVVIEGRRLRELRRKLARRQVTFIQQYSPLVWPAPAPGEPIVTSIAVVRPQAAPRRDS
jgi:hypothetical protein